MGCGCKKKVSNTKKKPLLTKDRLEEVRQRIITLQKQGKTNTKG